jgi:hypothetical protein
MNHRHAFAVWSLALGLFAVLASHELAAGASPPAIYLSLGTSLSVGIQPDENGDNELTDQGYADQLHRLLRLGNPELQLVKLGCPGETSDGMITGVGSICTYPSGSQLAQAVTLDVDVRAAPPGPQRPCEPDRLLRDRPDPGGRPPLRPQ